ncbi:MAG TPA: RluA family pseudouridine synthase [Trichocoleus sp.]
MLHPLSEFVVSRAELSDAHHPSAYWYEGYCPRSGALLRLPRTAFVESIARGLMQQLPSTKQERQEGKMYGVLLVETSTGEAGVLKAFSGLLEGKPVVAGWVPPIPGRDLVVLEEAQTLAQLEELKQALIRLQQIPERDEYVALAQAFETRLQQLTQDQTQRKQARQQQRQHYAQTLSGNALTLALDRLDQESRQDGIVRRRLKQERAAVLQSLQSAIEQADQQIQALKQQRKVISRQLQAQLHASYCLTNFAGQSLSLEAVATGLPTGTGECCAPKLLHYAATQGLKPIAMAEFWWGMPSSKGDKVPGEFYGACAERCQPLMGFLLSGLPQPEPIAAPDLPILYEDQWLIAVNKPAGLLSVPGRYRDRQDSVLSRLRHLLPEGMALTTVHRLDQDTSGVLLLARDAQTYRQISQQFQQRQTHKIYEAILGGVVLLKSGMIDLPLWSDPSDRPYQKVDWQRGKPSQTQFQVLSQAADHTRIELVPITGRTHQLRVHSSDPQGLGMPIWGDRLYGGLAASRLYLHAKELSFKHPQTNEIICLQAAVPF